MKTLKKLLAQWKSIPNATDPRDIGLLEFTAKRKEIIAAFICDFQKAGGKVEKVSDVKCIASIGGDFDGINIPFIGTYENSVEKFDDARAFWFAVNYCMRTVNDKILRATVS